MLLRKFSRCLSGVLLFWNMLAVSRFSFHVFMYIFFPISALKIIYFIIFRNSTDSLLSSILFQLSLPFIFARRLLVHFPITSKYNLLAFLVSSQSSVVYSFMSSLYMSFSTSYTIESKASGFNMGVFNSFSIILYCRRCRIILKNIRSWDGWSFHTCPPYKL